MSKTRLYFLLRRTHHGFAEEERLTDGGVGAVGGRKHSQRYTAGMPTRPRPDAAAPLCFSLFLFSLSFPLSFGKLRVACRLAVVEGGEPRSAALCFSHFFFLSASPRSTRGEAQNVTQLAPSVARRANSRCSPRLFERPGRAAGAVLQWRQIRTRLR